MKGVMMKKGKMVKARVLPPKKILRKTTQGSKKMKKMDTFCNIKRES